MKGNEVQPAKGVKDEKKDKKGLSECVRKERPRKNCGSAAQW